MTMKTIFLAYLVQVLVAQHLACLVGENVVLLEEIVRGKTKVIYKLHDGV